MTPEQKELREERQAICQVEKVSQPEIDKIFDCYPSMYGTERTEYRLETIIGKRVIHGQQEGKKAA